MVWHGLWLHTILNTKNKMKKVSLLVYCLLIVGFSMRAQETGHTLEVAGKASVKELPQEIVFRIPLKILDATYLGCSNRLAETLNDLKKDLSKNGIQEAWIKTNNYRISENMVYKDGQRKQDGYMGMVNIAVDGNYSPELMNSVLKSINSLELNYSINFSMSEDQKQRLTKIAMVNAVDDAKQKALVLSEAAGVKLIGIAKISYGIDTYRPEPFMTERVLSSQDDGASANDLSLSPPLTSLFKSVLIVWNIE
jgi:uncharacterized protein YggE